MADVNGTACVIAANPDVSGVGIRASLYALCLGGRILNFVVEWLAPKHNSQDFVRSTRAALSVQGLALLCTAIVQTFQGQLSLFHAIVVLHLLALLGINLASRGNYKGNAWARSLIDAALIVVVVAAFIAFQVYVWVKAETFGPQPECNSSTVYVIFGVSVYATSPIFRYVILATLAIAPAIFLLVLIVSAPCWVAAFCFGGRDRGSSRGCLAGCRGCFRGLRGCFGGSSNADAHHEDDAASVASSNATLDKLVTDGIQALGYTAFSIYAIVSLEQMIQRNNIADEEKKWTFGQIIAIFLLAGSLYDLLGVFVSSYGSQNPSHSEARPGEIEMQRRH